MAYPYELCLCEVPRDDKQERRGSDKALLASPCILQASLLAASYGSWILIRNGRIRYGCPCWLSVIMVSQSLLQEEPSLSVGQCVAVSP